MRLLPLLIAMLMPALAVGDESVPEVKHLTVGDLAGAAFPDGPVSQVEEISEVGTAAALDLEWHQSADGCMQTGVYETGHNRYTITEPYPYDELMIFISGGVTLTATSGSISEIQAGDAVMMPKGWTGVWDSPGYRKIYVIYDCKD